MEVKIPSMEVNFGVTLFLLPWKHFYFHGSNFRSHGSKLCLNELFFASTEEECLFPWLLGSG